MTDLEQPDKKVDDLIAWRYHRCRRELGLKREDAAAYALRLELQMSRLRALIANGCDPATAVRILL